MNVQQLWGLLTWTRERLVMAWSATIDSSRRFGLNWGTSVRARLDAQVRFGLNGFCLKPELCLFYTPFPPWLRCLALPWSVSCWIHSAARGCMQWMASHSLDDESWVYVSMHIPLIDFCILHIDIYALTIHIYVYHIVARISRPFSRVAV